MIYDSNMMWYDMVYDMIYLWTAIGLSPGGSTHLHTKKSIEQHK